MSSKKPPAEAQKKEDVFSKVKAKIESYINQAIKNKEWITVELAAVDYPTTIFLELVVNPSGRPVVRIRGGNPRNALVVNYDHIEALESLIELIQKSETLRIIFDIVYQQQNSRSARVRFQI